MENGISVQVLEEAPELMVLLEVYKPYLVRQFKEVVLLPITECNQVISYTKHGAYVLSFPLLLLRSLLLTVLPRLNGTGTH